MWRSVLFYYEWGISVLRCKMFIHCICIFLQLLLLLTALDLISAHLIFRIWWDEAADINPQDFTRVFQNWSIFACFILKWMGGLQTKIRWKVIYFIYWMLVINWNLWILNILDLKCLFLHACGGGVVGHTRERN